jgi:hypothetical protein
MKKKLSESEMTDGQRCEQFLTNLKGALNAVFGQNEKKQDRISAEMVFAQYEKDSYSILVDGWIELLPVMAMPENKTITKFGKTHVIKYEGERPMWAMNTLRFIPATRNEPEDVDINEIGNFVTHDAIHLVIELIAKSLYGNWQQYQSEKEMEEQQAEEI